MIPVKESSSREKLISATMQLMSSRGFESMGIHSILEEAGVTKSNFYYHFKSKEELCLAALDHMSDYFFEMFVDPILLDAKVSPKKRLHKLIDFFKQKMSESQCSGGCAFVNLSAETSDFHPAFRERITRHYKEYADRIAKCYEEGVKKGEFTKKIKPQQAAQMIMSLMNGTMLMSKVQKDPGVIEMNTSTLFSLISEK
ncbi:MAG: TetR/AcrR family transcriptional regulator [Candidatus Obscuribacterales bacterium]|nr:TetR/AcrR family transcriptional regulator [Candidatus Obscuribacterales bacterium]